MKNLILSLGLLLSGLVVGQTPVNLMEPVTIMITKPMLDSISEFLNQPVNESNEGSNFLILINQYREHIGVPPLILDTLLCNAAENQAEYMAKTNICGHTQPTHGFETMFDRIKKFNPNFNDAYAYVAENCLINNLINCYFKDKTISELSLDVWTKSSGHNRNMIDPKFKKIGISFKIVNKKIYATTVFSI